MPTLPNINGTLAIHVTSLQNNQSAVTLQSTDLTKAASSVSLATETKRTTQSTASVVAIYALSMTLTASTTLQGLPAFTLASPEFLGIDPSALTYQVFDDAGCTHAIASSGAASTVIGDVATFTAFDGPVTLDPTHTYVFKFFLTELHPTKLWTTDDSGNGIIGIDITDPNRPILTNAIAGAKTLLNDVSGIAIDADKNVDVITVNGQDPGNYFTTYGQFLTFPSGANGNTSPSVARGTDNGTYELRASDDGSQIVGVSNAGQATGGSGSVYDAVSLKARTISIDSDRTNFNGVAVSDNGTVATSANFNYAPGGVGVDFSVLTIGANSWYTGYTANAQAFGTPPPNYTLLTPSNVGRTYGHIAFDPKSANLIGLQKNSLDIYPQTGFILDQPTGTLSLPAGFTAAEDLAFTTDGRLYVLAQNAQGHQMILRYPAGIRASSTPDSIGDLSQALGNQTRTAMAIQQF